jgi:hypothetical protein
VLKSEKREREKELAEAAKTQLGLAHRTPVVHRTVSNGAPDTVRCARPALVNWPLSGICRRRTAIIHRTVRWCTGLSGEPTAASATVGRAIRARRVAPANGRLRATDYPVYTGQCPVCQRLQFCNGRLCHFRKEIRTGQ